jgi:hypothetical protein
MASIGLVKTADDAAFAVGITRQAATGVNRTWSPVGFIQPGVAKWVDRSAGIAVGFPTLTLSVRQPTKASRMYKVTVKMAFPTLDITSPSTGSGIQPQPSKAYECAFIGEFIIPERATLAERTLLLDNLHSLFFSTITASDGAPSDTTGSPLRVAVVDLEPVFGG